MLARLRRLLMLISGTLVAAAIVILLLYGLPRSTGDGFVGDLLRLDVSGMQAHLCPDTTLAQVGGAVSAGGGEIGSLLAQLTGSPVSIPGREILADTLVADAVYYPLMGAYVFRLKMGKGLELAGFKLDAGLSSPEITLRIAHSDLLHSCIHAG